MLIPVMIVDDEPLAVEELSRLIQKNKAFQVAATAANGAEALRKLKETKVEAVFLDIDMPLMSGLEVASRLLDFPQSPAVVFATAYNQYAVEAFEKHALDYLLKPYDAGRLEKTLQRIQERTGSRETGRGGLVSFEEDLLKKGRLKRLIGHSRGARDRMVIDPGDVFYFFVAYTDVTACLGREQLILRTPLKELLQILDPAQFAQTHKSHIVNLHKIEKVSPMFNGNFQIRLKHADIVPIPLSRRYAAAIKKKIGGW
ncbi:MAG: hypothetical protein A2Z83_04975 [Omnitrophica bacterium GWA2_52_8]|nr:MAG: hypothetical protein A2Z83_04975 [Omnitrophica bacterium GWA2_52_8]